MSSFACAHCGHAVKEDEKAERSPEWPSRDCFCAWCIVKITARSLDEPALRQAMIDQKVCRYLGSDTEYAWQNQAGVGAH